MNLLRRNINTLSVSQKIGGSEVPMEYLIVSDGDGQKLVIFDFRFKFYLNL